MVAVTLSLASLAACQESRGGWDWWDWLEKLFGWKRDLSSVRCIHPQGFCGSASGVLRVTV